MPGDVTSSDTCALVRTQETGPAAILGGRARNVCGGVHLVL